LATGVVTSSILDLILCVAGFTPDLEYTVSRQCTISFGTLL